MKKGGLAPQRKGKRGGREGAKVTLDKYTIKVFQFWRGRECTSRAPCSRAQTCSLTGSSIGPGDKVWGIPGADGINESGQVTLREYV